MISAYSAAKDDKNDKNKSKTTDLDFWLTDTSPTDRRMTDELRGNQSAAFSNSDQEPYNKRKNDGTQFPSYFDLQSSENATAKFDAPSQDNSDKSVSRADNGSSGDESARSGSAPIVNTCPPITIVEEIVTTTIQFEHQNERNSKGDFNDKPEEVNCSPLMAKNKTTEEADNSHGPVKMVIGDDANDLSSSEAKPNNIRNCMEPERIECNSASQDLIGCIQNTNVAHTLMGTSDNGTFADTDQATHFAKHNVTYGMKFIAENNMEVIDENDESSFEWSNVVEKGN